MCKSISEFKAFKYSKKCCPYSDCSPDSPQMTIQQTKGTTETMNVPEQSISLSPIIIKEEYDAQESSPKEGDPLGSSESPCCIFCFRGQFQDLLCDDPALREKIEFVLAAKLRSLKVLCCRNCSQMFDLFYNFKKSCLLALSKKQELLQALAKKGAEQKYAKTTKVPRASEVREIIKCSVCSKKFTDEDEHRYHINQHFGVKPFKCQVAGCTQKFTNPRDCFVHEAMCSVGPPPPRECDFCAFRFATEAELAAHKVTHSAPQFHCSRCGEAFLYTFDCESHEQACRFQAKDPLQNIKLEDTLEDLDEVLPTSDCDVSEEPEGDQVVEKVDEPRVDERLCKHCDQMFPLVNRTFFKHQKKCRPSARMIYPCSLCEKTFSKKMTLETHLNKHKGEKSFKCRKLGCDKTFFGYPARYSHEEHCGTKGFVCDKCGATLSSPDSLRIHRAKHDDPQIQCELCDKLFKTKSALQKHTATHSEERKFECETCGKKFKSAEANRVHQRIHTKEKPYACPECDQRFTYNCSLKAHLEKKACLMN